LNDGALEVVASGGSGTYNYSKDGITWTVAPNSPIFTGLYAGSYRIYVRDAASTSCFTSVATPITISQPVALSFNYAKKDVTCFGDLSGEITVTAFGGSGLYEYSKDNGSNWQDNNVFTGLAAGNYNVVVRNKNATACKTAAQVVTISQPAVAIDATLKSQVNVKCYGAATGQIVLDPVPAGASLQYSIDGGATWSLTTTFNNLKAGTYTVMVKNATCQNNNALMVIITEPAASLSISNSSFANITCSSNSSTGTTGNGTANVVLSGGVMPYAYQWINTGNGNPVSAGNIFNTANSSTISNMSDGTYRIDITDANSCAVSKTFTITKPADWNVVHTSTNVTVVGASDGSIKITTIAGGTAPYKITWADGVAYNDMTSRTNLAKGTYSFTITDASGCTYTRSVVISDNQALSVTFKGNDIKCFGEKTGHIDVNVSNGVPGYQLTWSGLTATGATPSGTVNNIPVVYSLANLEAGTYTLTIRDNNGAGATVSQIIVINQPTTPVAIAVAKTDVTCNGNNDGTIDVRASGGTPFAANTYDISIIPGSTVRLNSNVFKPLVPGAYSVVAVDSYGCSASQNVTITQPLPLSVTFTQTNVDCNGASTGSLTAKVNGRSPATSFRYDWYTVSGGTQTTYLLNGSATITNLVAGAYRVVVTAGSCNVTADAVITQNTAVTAVSKISNITTCQGDNTGSISLTLSGGVAPYLITYNVGGNPVTVSTVANVCEINGLYAGNYNILVADSKGCSTTLNNLVVTEPVALTVTGVKTNIDCTTPSTGTLNFNIAGGLTLSAKHRYSVTLNGPNGYSTTQVLSPAAGAITPVAYNSLNAGNYTLVVQDALSTDVNKCQVIESFTLSHIVIEGSMVQPTCQGLNNGEITNIVIRGAQPGYTATWSTVDGSGLDLTSLPQAGLTAGSYRLTVVEPAATGRGCTVTRDFVLTNQRTPSVDGAVADVTCYGGNNGSITAIVATEMTINQYNWSGPGITSKALSEQLNLVVGTYQLAVTDVDGCMATRTFDVHEPTAINYTLTSTLDNCNPHSSSITLNSISGGTGSVYHYYWQGPGIVATTANLTGLTKAGLYTVTASDDNNCQLVKSLYITEGIQLDTAVVRPMCFGGTNGSILVTAKGGSGNFKYTWSKNGVVIPTETTAAISNIGAGTYRAVVTDLTESVSGVSCSQSIDIVINDKAPFVIDESITPIGCFGETNGAINITVSGGTPSYQYLWNGSGVIAGAEDQSLLKGGTYSVTITDQNGCKASESYVITEPTALAFDLKVTQTSCAGDAGELEVLNASGGTSLATTPFYNFQWAGPGVLPVNTSTTKVSNLIAGDYTVQMSDKNGCKLTKSATLYAAIDATFSVKPQTCSNMPDGQIDLTVSGGVAPYTYAWTTVDGGNLVAGAQDQSGLASGTYTVTITDSRTPSCQFVINNIVVKQQSQLVVTGKVQPVLCFGNAAGSIKLTVAGGIGTYSYVWSGPGIVSQPADPLSVTGLIKGNYQVVVTDNTSGCQEMKQFTVDGPDALLTIDNITTTNVLCYGSTTGEIHVAAVGGTPYGTSPNEFYKYLWTGPIWLDSIANQVNLPAGNYTVRVKDGNGCLSDVSSVLVTQPAQPLSISLDEIIDVTVTGSSTGVIDISSAGGSGNHTYHWEECTSTGTFIAALPNTGTRIDNLSAGFYRVTVSDDNGCSLVSDIYPITEPGSPLTIVLNILKDIRPCNGDANGELAVNITGGTPDMSTGTAQYEIKLYRDGVLLSTSQGTSLSRNDLTEGVYDVVATDANGIIAKLQQLINEPSVLALTNELQQNVTCYNGNDGWIRVYVHGGQPNSSNRYQLSITGPEIQTVVTVPVGFYEFKNLSAGLHRIELIDDANGDGLFVANGAAGGDCHQVLSDIEITQPEAHVVLSGDAVVCEGYNNINNYTTLQLITTNWPDIASNNLTVTLSNGVPLTVNASPYFFSYEATSSEFLEITSVKVVNCQKGTYSGSAMIDFKSRPDVRIVGDATICSGETTPLTFYFDGVAPWSVTYNNGSADIVVNNIQTSPYVVNVNPSVNTTYTIKSVTDKYCTTDFSQLLASPKATVQVNSLPTSIISGNATICEGESTNLTFTLTGKAPWQVTYVADGVEQTIPDIMTSPYVVAVAPLQSASYVLKHVLDANGCEQDVNGSVLVTVNPQPDDPGAITGSLEVCQGESGVKYSIAAVTNDPGNTYVWTLPAGFTLTSGAGSTTITLDVSKNAVNGVIQVAVVNPCGTSSLTSEIYVTVNPLPDKPAPIAGPVKVCQGSTGIIYSIPATTNATSYVWSAPAGFNIVNGQGTTTIQVDMDPSQASVSGNITVTAVNDCGLGVVSDNLLVGIDPLPAIFAGTDENICSTSYIMKATNPGANYAGSWSVKSGAAVFSTPGANNSVVTNIAKGENVFVWTVRNNLTGCVSTDEVKITNNQLVVTASANLYESCTGGATVYGTAIESGDTKTKGLWTFANNSTGVFSNAAANQTTVSNLSSGSVILRWTLTRNGCASSADVAILNNKPAQASIINKLAVAERCVDSVQLIAQPIEANSSGRWNVISGSGVFDKPLNTTVNVTGLMKDTVNRFSWTVSRGGCSVTDYVNVRNNQVVWTAGTDQTVCNDYTALGGQIPRTELRGNVLWTVNRGNGSFANAMDARTRVDNLAFGENVFQWTITKNGCVSFDTVSVFSNKPSKATILTGNLSNCADTAVIEAVVPNPLNGLGYWGVTSGSGQIDALTASKTIVRGLKKGDNTLRWSVTSNGCTDYTEIKVTNKLVDVDAGRDFSSCSNIVKLSATAAPSGTTGEWSVVSNMGSGLFDPDNTTANATVYGISSLRDANDDMLRGNAFVWTITKDGCQSTDTVVVTYNGKDTNPSQSFTAGNDVDINLSTYTMAASPLNKDEVGTWTIVSGGGNFKDVHSPTTVVSSLVQGANVFRWTVTYNGCSWSDEVTVVNGQVTPADAGLNQTVCEDFAILHANEPNGVGKGEWSIVQGSGDFVNKSDPQTKVRYLGMGNNIFRWTISYNGSSSSKDEVTITNNMPQTANAGVDDMTCSDWYQLEGNDPNGRGVATWSIINGGGSLGTQAPSMRVTNLSQGTNIFKYEINNKGCTSIDSVKIINGLPTAPNAGVDRTICTDSVQLVPNNPTFGTGEWRIAEGFAQTPMTNNWAKQLAPGVNKFVWVITTEYQCTLTDTVKITSNKPTTSFAGYNQDICGDTAKLLGNGTEGKGIGTWYRITGSGSIDNPLNANTIVRSLGRGSNRFRWVIDNQGCISSSDVEVVNNLIVADAGFSQTLCADSAIISGNTAFPGVGTWGVLSGSQGAKFDDPDAAYTAVRNLDRGENILTWTIDHKGCKSISKVSITNNMPTDANAGPNVKTCNDYVTLSAGSVSQGSGSWTIRNGGGTFDDLTSPTANVTNLSVGSNIFRWTTEYKGCSSTDDVEVAANTIKAIVGPDQPNLCSNTTTLQANSAAPGVGTWSVNGGGVSQATFEDVNNPNTVVSNLGKGKNTLRWTIINEGCPSFAELVIVNNSPSASYAGNSQEVCNAQVVLDATVVPAGTGVGHWEVLTGAAKISDLNDAKATVTELSQGDNVFRWSVVNGTCIDNDEVLIVNNKPSTPYAGNDEELCSTDYQLKAGAPEFGSGNWSIFKGSGTIDKPNSPETSISNVGYNENIFIWTITQGQCQLTDSVKLINNTPTKAQAGPDIQDCKSVVELDANIPGQDLGTGLWTLISGKGAFREDSNAKTEVYDLGFGENILQWTITKGHCFSSDQISVFNKIPDQALAGSDRTICDNYVVLNANNPVSGSGSWSVLSGQGEFEDKTRFDTKVKSVGFGTNQYKWTIAYGECVTEDIVVVTSNKAYPYAGEDDVVYKPNYSLKASNPGDLKGQWTLLGGGGDFENSSFFNTAVSNLNEGVNTYRWTIDVNGCMAYDDVSITYKLIPDAGFVVDTTKGCYPLTVQFTNYSLGGTVYNWDFGDGQTSADRNPKHIYTDEGEYTAVLTIPGPDGNDDVFSQRISVYGHPKAEFNVSPSTVYIPGESVRCYNLTNDARSYVWDFGDGTTSTEPTPMHEYLNEGVYDISLTAINQYGCEDVFYINSAVEAIKQGFIVFPNAFAPRPDVSNGVEQPNGVNEVFRPKYKDIDTYHLQIFDRWGQLIYESDDITLGWDGTYKNKPSAQDVYVFKAWGTFISGQEFRVTGNVLLVK
jgi:gliding motility-associated-like protein